MLKNKLFQFAAYSHLVLLIMFLIFSVFLGFITLETSKINLFNFIYLTLGLILGIVVYYAFILLGSTFKNKFLIRIALIEIIVLIIKVLYSLFGEFSIGFDIIDSITSGTLGILFGTALFSIRQKIKYAKTAGILNIISGVIMLIFITLGTLSIISGRDLFIFIDSVIIHTLTVISEMFILFEASKRFEKQKRTK